ncbi:hypothetical protein [Marinicrinis sediminis]|uniref:Uncharacterized protein n=1 Tax=Marinicrinis sediminis TaxID=1652465 RepID=A0ABW5RHP6_9BACL
MYNLRSLQQLEDVRLKDWKQHELDFHHRTMSDLSPWLNAQGVSKHHEIIEEIESRGKEPDTEEASFTD